MNRWVLGARPRTLPASIVPVAIGTALSPTVIPWRALCCLGVAVFLQVGVNYANDYFDGTRGVDTESRVGPVRLVASGLATSSAVRTAALVSLSVAAVLGAVLAIVATPWFFAIGAGALAAAMLYSGGPRPYASLGLGEVFVFVFFGLVAVAGTVYAQSERLFAGVWWCAVASGLLSVSLLLINNLRDIQTDVAAGKRTLAGRIGDARTRILYRVCVSFGIALPVIGAGFDAVPQAAALSAAAALVARTPLGSVGTASGPALVPVLEATALTHTVFGAALVFGLVLARTGTLA